MKPETQKIEFSGQIVPGDFVPVILGRDLHAATGVEQKGNYIMQWIVKLFTWRQRRRKQCDLALFDKGVFTPEEREMIGWTRDNLQDECLSPETTHPHTGTSCDESP